MLVLLMPPNELHDVELADKGWSKGDQSGEGPQRVLASRELPAGILVVPAKLEANPSGGEEVSGSDDPRIAAIRDRVAANILLRSGLLSSALEERQDSPPPATILFKMEPNPTAWNCTGLYQPPEPAAPDAKASSVPGRTLGSSNTDAQAPNNLPQVTDDSWPLARRMALVAVAVEMTYRNSIHRWLKMTYVRLVLRSRGWLPDLSLGPAQIRPSTLRALAASTEPKLALPASDAALLAVMNDECHALGLAAWLVHSFLRNGQPVGANLDAEAAAWRYAGRHPHAGQSAVIDYAPVVEAGAQMLPQ